LHEKAREYYWEGAAPLSIKTFFAGRALYTLGKGFYAVDETAYLIVNHNQPYAITIETQREIESFCLFFEPGFAEEIQHSLTTPVDGLLDLPAQPATSSLHFFERTYRHDNLLSPLLFQLRTTLVHQQCSPLWLSEQFCTIIQRLLQVHFNVYKEVETLPAVRAATREELYRRLYRAREYACAFFDTPVTLTQLAEVASLSPTHLLRSFKQLFHQSPHQYLTSKRLERAQHLLLHTDLSVTDICFSVGFESFGSFSWLFRRKVGCSPSAYRAHHLQRKFPVPIPPKR
jgi:AraC-like DNA-binding protein